MSQHASNQSSSNALIPALLLFGGITLILVAAFAARPSQHTYAEIELTGTASVVYANQTSTAVAQQEVALAATATQQAAQPTATVQEVVQVAALDPAAVSAGETVFQTVCAACHGFNAKGIPGLGKTLVDSPFVNDLNDDDLLTFIQQGRDVTDPLNTTGVMMPARGGNPGLTDDDLRHVVAYIRSLNVPSSGGEVAAAPSAVPSPAGPTATPYVFVPLPLSSSGDAAAPTAESTEISEPVSAPYTFASNGEEWYVRSCSGCHGIDGSGVPYVAPSLADSQLLKNRDGLGLLNFLTSTHPPVNPEIAYPHPYRGGYPELSDAQLQEVIVYLYSLPG